MTVLLFTEACAAGVGRHVMDLADGLAANGNTCHLVVSPNRMDRRFAERLPRHTRVLRLPIDRSPHPSDFCAAFRLRRYILRHGPFDVLHAHSTKAGLLLRLAAAGLPGAVCYTPHAPLTMNPRLPPLVRALLAACELALSCLTSRLIAVSQEEAEHIAGWGVHSAKIRVVPNGIQPETAVTTVPRSDRNVYIGSLGRLNRQKNTELLLQAFADAFPNLPAVRLIIAGTGPEETRLRALAASLGIAERVTWPGECSSAVMSTFDVFALSSSYEGMPYVLLEALSAGLPVVSTAVGGVRSVIEHGVEGFVVKPGCVRKFAAALCTLVQDAPLRERMARAARAKASCFTLSRMVSETAAVYAGTIGPAAPLQVSVRTSKCAAD